MINLVSTRLPEKYRRFRRQLTQYERVAREIEALRPQFAEKSLDGLRLMAEELVQESRTGVAVERLLPRAFALVAETAWQLRREYPYTVQFMGAVALHEGHIVEMLNGEGKTLAATMPTFLHLLPRGGEARGQVHIVTDNDYLVRRDALRMGAIFRALGLSVGAVWKDGALQVELEGDRATEYACSKHAAYQADVVYVDKNELITDYLRDNLARFLEYRVLRGLDFAIVDEADSILIDEARTPVILTVSNEDARRAVEQFRKADEVIRQLVAGEDYVVDKPNWLVRLTDAGEKKSCRLLGVSDIYEDPQTRWFRFLSLGLQAHSLYEEGKDYFVDGTHVVLIDEKTGRPRRGSRYGGGLHQALEARHGLQIGPEAYPIATITVQNFFKNYKKLAGMTGTAQPEDEEFEKVYQTSVVCIPPLRPSALVTWPDLIYKTKEGKLGAVAEEVERRHQYQQPVLVGTQDKEETEYIARLLRSRGMRPALLTAVHHANEAEIIQRAGRRGAITIAARMAGRGTDIVPDDDVLELGGLAVLGTERVTRRFDDQLCGRTARRGAPGECQFFLSLEDDLIQRFNPNLKGLMDRLGLEDDVPIENRMVTASISNAQKRLHLYQFNQRQWLFRRDSILDIQRTKFYQLRNHVLQGERTGDLVDQLASAFVFRVAAQFLPGTDPKKWELMEFRRILERVGVPGQHFEALDRKPREENVRAMTDALTAVLRSRRQGYAGVDARYRPEGLLLLSVLDDTWADHLRDHETVVRQLGVSGGAWEQYIQRYSQKAETLFSRLFEKAESDFLQRWHELHGAAGRPARFAAELCDSLGHMLNASRRYAEAINALKQAIALDPQLASARYHLAWSYWNTDQTTAALEEYLQTLRLEPEHTSAWREVAGLLEVLYAEPEQAAVATEAVQRLLQGVPGASSELQNLGAQLMRRANNHEAARAVLEQVVAAEPDSALAHSYLGDACFELQDYPAALKEYQQVLVLDHDEVSEWAYFDLGRAQQQLEDHEEAVAAFTQALELKPEWRRARILRARSLVALGRHAGAIGDLQAVVEELRALAPFAREDQLAEVETVLDSIPSETPGASELRSEVAALLSAIRG